MVEGALVAVGFHMLVNQRDQMFFVTRLDAWKGGNGHVCILTIK